MKKLLALAFFLIPTVASAQAIIVPEPIPAPTDACIVQWDEDLDNYVCVSLSGAIQPLTDSSALMANSGDSTKRLSFSLANIGTGTTRTWTIPNADITFPTTIASLGANTFTGTQTATLFSGSGASLTDLSATQLTSGTVPLARISGLTNAEISAAAAIAYSKLAITGSIVNADISASAAIAWSKLSLTGSSLADLATRSASDLSSGTLPDGRFPATLPAASGANLTNLDATDLTGTVDSGRLSGVYTGITGVGTLTHVAIGTNPASAGAVRLANGEWITGRNAANSADVNLLRLNSSDVVELGAAIGPTSGGTGQTTYTTGDMLYATGANTLGKLAAGANGYFLVMSGGVPVWTASSVAGHDILSATHTDTTVGTVARGDLITGQGGTPTWTRLAKGAAGTFLRSDGTDVGYSTDGSALTALNASNLGSGTVPDARFPATLPAASGVNLTALNASNLSSGTIPDARFPAVLPAVSGANLTNLPGGVNVLSKSAAYTVATSDGSNVVVNSDASGGAFTVTLYTASGNAGKVVTVKKTSSGANAVTVDAHSTETIEGKLSRVLYSQYDTLTLVSNGTSWNILDEQITVKARAYRATSSQVIGPSAWTKGQLNAETVDTASAFDSSTNYRFTVPTYGAGWYRIQALGYMEGLNGNRFGTAIYINGANRSSTLLNSSGSAIGPATLMVELADGDYVEMYVYQDRAATNLDFNVSNSAGYYNFMEIERVR